MHRLNKSMFAVATSAVLLVAGAILYADAYLAPTTSTGAETVGGSIINVGQGIIGRADDGRNVFAHMGVVPIYLALSPPTLGDCTGNHIVDLDDYAVLQQCMDGVGGGLGVGCDCADLDGDSDVDLRDAFIHFVQH